MFIDKDSIIINNVSMGQYLAKAKYEHPKLWAEDTGRNLAGKMTGTLLGIYPKITLSFKKLTKSQMNVVAPILDSASQTLSYYDPTTNRTETIQTYSGDWSYTNDKLMVKNNIERKNESFDCTFISIGKR
jgi:hypothetical protein